MLEQKEKQRERERRVLTARRWQQVAEEVVEVRGRRRGRWATLQVEERARGQALVR